MEIRYFSKLFCFISALARPYSCVLFTCNCGAEHFENHGSDLSLGRMEPLKHLRLLNCATSGHYPKPSRLLGKVHSQVQKRSLFLRSWHPRAVRSVVIVSGTSNIRVFLTVPFPEPPHHPAEGSLVFLHPSSCCRALCS